MKLLNTLLSTIITYRRWLERADTQRLPSAMGASCRARLRQCWSPLAAVMSPL